MFDVIELRVRDPETGESVEPDDIHILLMELHEAEDVDFDDLNKLLLQCKKPAEAVMLTEDEAEHEPIEGDEDVDAW